MISLLAPHTTILMRHHDTSDKDAEALDLDQLFNQYVETENLPPFSDSTASTAGPSSDSLAHLFELPGSNGCGSFEMSVLPNWDTDASWHQAADAPRPQNLALPSSPPPPNSSTVLNSSSVYPESGGKACLSDPGLFTFDALFDLDTSLEPRAVSQPNTPEPHEARTIEINRSSPDRKIRRSGIQKQPGSAKKSSLASFVGKMLQPSHYRAGIPDLWTRKMDLPPDNFSLGLLRNGLHSPPTSTKLLQSESMDGLFVRGHTQPYTLATDDPITSSDLPQTSYQLTPLSSPAIDTNSSRNTSSSHFDYPSESMASAYISQRLNSGTASFSTLQTPPSNGLPMAAWGSETSPSLDFSNFSASPEFGTGSGGTGKAEGWWDGPAISQPGSPGGGANAYQTTLSSRASQRVGSAFSNQAVAGLGISCDSASFGGFSAEMGNPAGAASFDVASYSSMYDTSPGIPIGIALANPRSSSRSPSLSPQPRFTRRRHPNHHAHSAACNTQNTSSHSRSTHRRKSSNSSTHSRSASQSASGGGFVNFTPSDSRKILTGVAPSGSSKTKARREKEAADKRRKLSQAAVRAVVEAGGDLGRLEKEIMVLDS